MTRNTYLCSPHVISLHFSSLYHSVALVAHMPFNASVVARELKALMQPESMFVFIYIPSSMTRSCDVAIDKCS